MEVPASALVSPPSDRPSSSRSGKLVVVIANEAAVDSADWEGLHAYLQTACDRLHMPLCPLERLLAEITTPRDEPCTFHMPKTFTDVRNIASRPHSRQRAIRNYYKFAKSKPVWPTKQNIIYTDGSAAPTHQPDADAALFNETSAAQAVGAEVYRQADALRSRVDPCGQGATNTIQRAELSAICSALDHACSARTMIATDSKTSMHLIQNQLQFPAKKCFSPHSVLVAHIAGKVCDNARRGMHTSVIKVKAHTGLTGNEMANTLANEARQPAACDTMVSVGNTAFPRCLLAVCLCDGDRAPAHHVQPCDAIKQKVRHLSRGFASRGMYEGFWQDVMGGARLRRCHIHGTSCEVHGRQYGTGSFHRVCLDAQVP